MSIFDPENEKTIRSDLDPDRKVDISGLKHKIAQHGPLRVQLGSTSTRVVIDAHPCSCGDDDCTEDVITATHDWGELPIVTTVDPEELCDADSLTAFCQAVATDPLVHFTSHHERQKIEAHLANLMRTGQFEIYSDDLDPREVLSRLSKTLEGAEDTPKALALLALAGLLRQHNLLPDHLREAAAELTADCAGEAGQSLVDLVHYAYDLGFLTARLKDNYFVECQIAPWAEKGISAQQAQEKRARSGAAATAAKAERQRASLVSLIEDLLRAEPLDFIMLPVDRKARHLRAAAQTTRPEEFSFRKGDVLSHQWFVDRLEDLQADGTLKQIFATATRKA